MRPLPVTAQHEDSPNEDAANVGAANEGASNESAANEGASNEGAANEDPRNGGAPKEGAAFAGAAGHVCASTSDEDAAIPCRRSRLTSEREAELFEATLQLLAETGYEALTMDAVAARAHASKATIYRLWQGKSRLVAAALRHMKSKDPHQIDTGSIAGDLHTFVGAIGKAAAENAQLVSAIARAVQLEPELRTVLRECFLGPDTDTVGVMLQRAVERGEIDPGNPALTRIAPLVFSVMLGRPVIEGAPVDEASLLDLVDSIILPALQAPPVSSASRPRAKRTTATREKAS